MSTTGQNHAALVELWEEIERMGGPERYIRSELQRMGVPIRSRIKITRIKDDKQRAAYIKARKREEEARAPLRRKVWQAYKATHLVHLGLDFHWNDVVGVDFFDPYQRRQRLEDNALPEMESVAQFIERLQEAVPDLNVPMLRWLCYHRDVAQTIHYRPFVIPKRSGGVRHIWAPMPKMKAMQRWILHNVAERLAKHGSAHGFIVGRSILTNAVVHTDSQVVVGVDLKDFFPSFTFPRVKGIFRAAGYLEGIATLMALLCTEAPRFPTQLNGKTVYVATGPRCLPQGSPASPALTNAACLRLDRRLAGYARKFGWRYTRYADDLTFSYPNDGDGKPRVDRLLKVLGDIVRTEGFTVHPDKTAVMGPGDRQEVTGLVVNGPDTPRVPRDFRRMLRAAVHNLQQGKPFHEDENIQTLTGYASFLFSTDPEAGRARFEQLSALTDTLQETD
ncbi:MAG: reverse transcriptase family protein [Myxococcota bacterium]